MLDNNSFSSKIKPTWCPGCGNFAIFKAVKAVLKQLKLNIDDLCLFYDVGCSSNWADFFLPYGFHGLHGRALSAAVGASLAHHKIPIIAVLGDGGAYGEGLNHFISACRANYNLTLLVTNNQLYSLTTGQMSPTTYQGEITKSTPTGSIEKEFNPLTTAIVNHCTFVGRGFAFDIPHLTELLTKAIVHQGFALVDVLQPCVTFNKSQPIEWYKKSVYKLEQDGFPQSEALAKAQEQPLRLPIGIFYKENRPTFQAQLSQLKDQPLIHQPIENINIDPLLKEFI